MKKALLIIGFIVLFIDHASAQGIRVYKKDGTVANFPYTDLDSLVAYGYEEPVKGINAVDLGLSVKWANMNVGATSPEDYGCYFAWGEIDTKLDYSWNTYFDSKNGSSANFIKYGTIKKTMLDPEDDAAHVYWGGSWRMPTLAELKELYQNCTGVWTTQNSVNGVKLTSKKNGKSIFLPAAGQCRFKDGPYNVGYNGFYWAGELCNSKEAYCLKINSYDILDYSWLNRGENGFTIRPVCP